MQVPKHPQKIFTSYEGIIQKDLSLLWLFFETITIPGLFGNVFMINFKFSWLRFLARAMKTKR